MHPIIDEICRTSAPRPDVLRRWQRQLRDEVQPLLDELATLRAERDAAASTKTDKRKGREAVTA